MRYDVIYQGQVDAREDDLERLLDDVMEELVEVAIDPSISTTLTTGEVEVAIVVEADDLDAAHELGSRQIRSAFHVPVRWVKTSTTDQELVEA